MLHMSRGVSVLTVGERSPWSTLSCALFPLYLWQSPHILGLVRPLRKWRGALVMYSCLSQVCFCTATQLSWLCFCLLQVCFCTATQLSHFTDAIAHLLVCRFALCQDNHSMAGTPMA